VGSALAAATGPPQSIFPEPTNQSVRKHHPHGETRARPCERNLDSFKVIRTSRIIGEFNSFAVPRGSFAIARWDCHKATGENSLGRPSGRRELPVFTPETTVMVTPRTCNLSQLSSSSQKNTHDPPFLHEKELVGLHDLLIIFLHGIVTQR